MSAGKLVFACGAFLEAKDVTNHAPGERLLTHTSPQQKHQRPVPPDRPDLRMNCMILCPCSVRESGRKTQRGWFQDGTQGFMTTCRVKDVIRV